MRTIPETYQEIESIVRYIDDNQVKCITVTAPESNAGASTLALSLANRLKKRAQRILVLDLNRQHPMKAALFESKLSLPKWQFDTISTQLNVAQNAGLYFLSVDDLQERDTARDSKVIADAFCRWQQEFDYVIVDLCPLLSVNKQNLPSSVFAAVSELTLMMVAPGKTTEETLKLSLQKCKTEGFKQIQIVVSQIHLPPLGPKLEHSLNNLRFMPKNLKCRLLSLVKRQAWLYRAIGC